MRFAGAAALGLTLLACSRAGGEPAQRSEPEPMRIVAVGGAVTETVFALGAGSRIVATDTSSVYPPEIADRPRVGYQRTLAAEPILALAPDLVLVSSDAGPRTALDQLRAAGARVAMTPPVSSPESAAEHIRAVATALGRGPAGLALADRVEREARSAAEHARATLRSAGPPPRVLFVYARSAGAPMIAGRATAADAMLYLVGAENAVSDYEGFRPLSAEAMVAAAPDVLLLPAGGFASIGGETGLLALPGVSETPAGRTRRIVAMDDLLLLGFGPRLPVALDELGRRLAGERK